MLCRSSAQFGKNGSADSVSRSTVSLKGATPELRRLERCRGHAVAEHPRAITTLTNAINVAGNLALGTGQYVLQGVIAASRPSLPTSADLEPAAHRYHAQAQTVLASVTTVPTTLSPASRRSTRRRPGTRRLTDSRPDRHPGYAPQPDDRSELGAALSVRTEISGLVQRWQAPSYAVAAPPFPPVAAVPPNGDQVGRCVGRSRQGCGSVDCGG